MVDTSGRNLIFIISQPRSGSTLLQRILGGHPDIHTLSEPWIMLKPLRGLRDTGKRDLDELWGWEGVRSFVGELPNREDDYFEGVRRMYAYLYDQALRPSNKRFFLDKTPRYYAIIPELLRVFPRAHYVILLRQPLAVCASLLDTPVRLTRDANRWKRDLLDAPRLLLDGITLLGEQGLSVHYEALVRDPEAEIRRICTWLDIKFHRETIDYGASGEQTRWVMGDKAGIYQNTRPVDASLNKWTASLENPQFWRAAQDYLQTLGQDTLSAMGYSSQELQQTLDRHRPSGLALWGTMPLRTLLMPVHKRLSAIRRLSLAARRVFGLRAANPPASPK